MSSVFQCVLSASAAFTSGVACKAPSTTTELMVARASSGVTSGAIVARPSTLISMVARPAEPLPGAHAYSCEDRDPGSFVRLTL
jgi:hypothetical protein